MERKNLVIKSKSSNSAITSKPDPNGGTNTNKKSWSSARFGEVNSKKRGVYVEKKPANNTLTRVAPGPSDVLKAPKRPRRGEKNFLNSCLSILSQETTATQFPEVGKPVKARRFARVSAAETVDKGTQDLDAIYSGSNSPVRNKPNAGRGGNRYRPPSPPKPRKPRFRSKALSENFNDNRLVILQHQKALPRSPSRNSSGGTKSVEGRQILGSERPSLLANTSHENKIEDKKDDKRSDACDDKKSDLTVDSKKKKVLLVDDHAPKGVVASSVHDEVKSMATTESKKSKKVLRIEEPDTLVSNYSSKNKSLYNFFVDLLETTCDVYNVNTECKRPPTPKFEIEDKVAQKLKINEPIPVEKSELKFETVNKVQSMKNNQVFSNSINVPVNDPSRRLYFVTDDGVTDKIAVYQAGPLCHSWNPPLMKPKRYRSPYKSNFKRNYRETYGNDYRSNLKSESFRYAQQLKIQEAARAESFIKPKKNFGLKPNKKRSLLSLLKKELQLDEEYFEEPASFYQALSIIARNKRRTQKAIHQDDSSVRISIGDRKSRAGSSDCFKRRKIISSSTKSPRKKKHLSFMKSFPSNNLSRDISMTVFSEGPARKNNAYESDEASVHSIEVDGYDYAPNQYVRRLDTKTNELVYSSNSGVSLRSETITSSKDYLECLKKCGKSLSPALSGTVSTAISQLLLRDVYNNDMF